MAGLELLANASLLWRSASHDCLHRSITMMMWMMRSHRYGARSALDILNKRYARGEIDKTEYEERRRMLRS